MGTFQQMLQSDALNVFLNTNDFALLVQLTPEVNATPGTYGTPRSIKAVISETIEGVFESGSDAINADYREMEIYAGDDVSGRVTPTEVGRGTAADPTKAYSGDKYTLPGDARTWYCRKVEVNGAITPGKIHKMVIATSQGVWQR